MLEGFAEKGTCESISCALFEPAEHRARTSPCSSEKSDLGDLAQFLIFCSTSFRRDVLVVIKLDRARALFLIVIN